MADILIRNGTVIAVDPERRIIPDGAVAIEGDRIVAVGPSEEVARDHPARETIDARGMAVMPGFVDSHAHAGHGLIKTMGGGRSDLWYRACQGAYTVGSTPEFWHAEAQLAALERLRFGVTTGVSLLGGGDSVMRTDDPVYGDAHMEGVLGIGTRSVVAVGTTRPPHPLTYARWEGSSRTDYPVSFDQQLATSQKLVDRWHRTHEDRLHVALLTPNSATLPARSSGCWAGSSPSGLSTTSSRARPGRPSRPSTWRPANRRRPASTSSRSTRERTPRGSSRGFDPEHAHGRGAG